MPQLIAAAIAFAIPAAGTATVAGISIATIAGNLIFTGGLYLASTLLAPSVPGVEEQKITQKQSIPDRIWVAGSTRVGGAFVLSEAKDGVSHDVIAMMYGQTSGFRRLYLHDDVITLDGGGFVNPIFSRYGDGYIHIETRDGLPTETVYTDLIADLPEAWTSDHRGDNVTSVYMRCISAKATAFSKKYPRGLPQFSAAIDAPVCWDPSDEDQDPLDPGTWTFSNGNAIREIIRYLRTPRRLGGGGVDFERRILPRAAELAVQTAICDEDVPKKAGGTEKRYRLCGSWKHRNDPADILPLMLASCDGTLGWYGDGTIRLRAGKLATPTVTIRDRHILALTVDRGRSAADKVTTVSANYTSEAQEYSTADSERWPSDEAASETNDRVLPLSLPYVPAFGQCRRLQKRAYNLETASLRGTMRTTLYGLAAVESEEFPYAKIALEGAGDPLLEDATVRIARYEEDLKSGTVLFDWVRIDDPAGFDSWNAATEEGSEPQIQEVVEDSEIPIPQSVNATAELDANGTIYIDVTFTTPERTDLEYWVALRLADIGGGTPGDPQEIHYGEDALVEAAGVTTLTIPSVRQDTQYEIAVAAETSSGVKGAYSGWVPVDTANVAPGSPTFVDATVIGGTAALVIKAPNSENVVKLLVYRAVGGQAFNTATLVSGDLFCSPQQEVMFDDEPGAGTWDYYATAVGALELASTPAGPQQITIGSGGEGFDIGDGSGLDIGTGDFLEVA